MSKKKRLIPTTFGKIVYRSTIDPVTANYIFLSLCNIGDVEAKIEGYIQFLEEARLYGIANDRFVDGSYDVSVEDYKKFDKYKEILKEGVNHEDEQGTG